MGSVNMSSVKSKIYAFLDTKDGQGKMDDALQRLVRSGKSTSHGGSTVVTQAVAEKLLDDLRECIIASASSAGLPPSVMASVSAISSDGISLGSDGRYLGSLTIGGELFRVSLYPERYGGVSNVVALYNEGYDSPKSRYVWGIIDGNKVRGRGHLDPAHFMENGVAEFNSKYGAKYDAHASLTGDFS